MMVAPQQHTTMSSNASPTTDQPVKQPAAGRLPSLNQLAARINLNAPNGTSSSSVTASAARPRLAASILRTGSSASVSTTATASTADSLAVNLPTTRSTSPSTLSTSPPKSDATLEPEGGEALTSEKLEKLNKETGSAPAGEKKKVHGYKNIPSLDAITARLAKARIVSVDGSEKPPEAKMIEDPKTPGVIMKAPELPLQFSWTIYHDSKAMRPFTATPVSAVTSSGLSEVPYAPHPPESTDYEANLTVIGEFDTVESFCRYFNWLKPPSKLEKNSNYHLFKSGIKPMWEDEANANGGKWVLTMKNNPTLLDRCWNWLAMALVGEELEDGDEICGAVVSLRSKVDRLQVWTRSKDDVERLNAIGKKLVKLLDVSEADNIGLEFQYNTDDRPLPNKFLSIQAVPTTSYRSTFQGATGPAPGMHAPTRSIGSLGPTTPSEPNSASAGGAFGNFGMWKPTAKRTGA